MIGRTIAHYQILEKLGEGGMGVVYKAHDTHLDRSVAIKVLRADAVTDSERRRRFVQEAKAASALNHPNIITIYDINRADGVDFIAMEYIPGRSLAEMVAGKGLPVAETLKYAVQIADALAMAHEAGIVHRDVKPANIMVTDKGLVKVLDFGLAKLAETDIDATRTQEGGIAGTIAYMSPEQAEGKRVDSRSDVFSFGAVLYEMLSGRRAFAKASGISTLRAIVCDEPLPLPVEAPAELQKIINRCLRKDPNERYHHTADLKLALEEYGRPRAALPSIAVLPFANLSADKENEYFSDGLAEEILNALTKVPGLRVTARTSAFAFRGKDLSVREIGARLSVDHILEGSVRKAGNRVRVTAQLIKVADEYHLWSDRYDRELTDVFAIQDEISQAIVDKLRVELAPGRPLVKRYTDNVEAYNLLLQARYHLFRFTPDALAKSKQYFEQAIALDPNYAPAHAGLAVFHWHTGFFGYRPPQDVLPDCRQCAWKALELDETIADAHAVMGILRVLDFDWKGADRHYRRALELDPDDTTVSMAFDYFYLVPMGRLSEAVAASQRAVERDPLSSFAHWRLGVRFYLSREFELAAQKFHQALELEPTYSAANAYLALVCVQQRKFEEAIQAGAAAEAPYAGSPFAVGWVAAVYAQAGRVAEAQRRLEHLLDLAAKSYVPPTPIGWIYLALGDKDRAIEWFDKAIEGHDGMVLHLAVDPIYDPLRADPRYHALLRKMNLEG